jgi:hypothetical protein
MGSTRDVVANLIDNVLAQHQEPMKLQRLTSLLLTLFAITHLQPAPAPVVAENNHPPGGDAFLPPPPPPGLADSNSPAPDRYQPSAFMAGRVSVQVIFIESDGSVDPSTEDWTVEQVDAIQGKVAEALDWWRSRLPHARLSFTMQTQIVPSRYEPIKYQLREEGHWISDALGRLGHVGTNYFEQAYNAADTLRKEQDADWATTIFIVNSAADQDGRFADGYFAYAYIGGPFTVITSDAGPYGMNGMTSTIAHEFGHIFGALDQYASAGISCNQQSGYLSVPNSNSQLNNCGTRFVCIMLDPQGAYAAGKVDSSALGQVGYRDEDGDTIPDPLDTAPAMQIKIVQSSPGARPIVTGSAVDQPYVSQTQRSTTINRVERVEYRVDQGDWLPLPAKDGAFDSATESIEATAPLYNGKYTIEVRAVNNVGAASAPVRQSVEVNTVGPPPNYSVDVPELSNSRTIPVILAAPLGAAIQISEDANFNGADWRAIQSPNTYEVLPYDGPHTIYVRFRDQGGIESPIFIRRLVLDRQPPRGQGVMRGNAPPMLELDAQDTTSPVVDMQITINGTTASDWQPYQPVVQLPETARQVAIQFRDAAGNISDIVTAQQEYQIYLPFSISSKTT